MSFFQKCYFKNEYMNISDAKIGITSLSYHYAISVFEGIRIYINKKGFPIIFKLEEHLDRLRKSAEMLNIFYSDYQHIADVITNLISMNNIEEDSYIRISLGYNDYGELSNYDLDPVLGIVIRPSGRKKWLKNGEKIKVKVSSFRKPTTEVFPAFVKCISNYAIGRIEMQSVKKEGFDTVLYINNSNKITESITSIIFFVKENKLYTPPLSDNILHSITREFIIQLASEIGVECVENSILLNEISSFEEAFLCGTGMEIAPIDCIDNIKYTKNITTNLLIDRFFENIRDLI